MRSFTIKKEDDGIRLNRYLMRMVPALPAGMMHRYLRAKRIKVNGRRCDAATRLIAGDVLALYIDDSFFVKTAYRPDFTREAAPPDILYEDVNIAVLHKPAGLLSHSAKDEYGDSLLTRLLHYLYRKDEYAPDDATAFTPALCNRLDRGTEGIVVAAKNAAGLRGMNAIIKGHRLQKRYLCAVTGLPPRDGVYTAYLTKDKARNTVRITDRQARGAKPITTGIRTVAKNEELSLLEIDLVTGRPHQIRAHLAHLGCPVLGDPKYGDAVINKRYGLTQQALCAYKIIFALDSQLDTDLFYLDGHSFEIGDVWFKKKYFSAPRRG